jgi:hypothetical protein
VAADVNSYDAWFRAQVQTALDDARAGTSQVQVMQAAAVQVLLRGGGAAGDIATARLVASRLLTETRRSEQQIRLQQFSTPLPFAALAVRAAAVRKGETVLEPSAGTGALAAFAARAGATLVLNEIDPFRQRLLCAVFGGVTPQSRSSPRSSASNLSPFTVTLALTGSSERTEDASWPPNVRSYTQPEGTRPPCPDFVRRKAPAYGIVMSNRPFDAGNR